MIDESSSFIWNEDEYRQHNDERETMNPLQSSMT